MTVPTHSYPSFTMTFDDLERMSVAPYVRRPAAAGAVDQALMLFDVLPLAHLTPEEVVQFELLATNSPTQAEATDALAAGCGVSCVQIVDVERLADVLKGVSYETLV